MSYYQLTNNTAKFGTEIYGAVTAYKAKQKELAELVKRGEVGYKEAERILEEMKTEIHNTQRTKGQALLQEAERVRASEVEKLEASQLPLTTNNAAELSLLAQLELTQADIRSFTQRYAQTPLALRLIEQLAKKHELVYTAPHSKLDDINFIDTKVKGVVNTFTNEDIDGNLVMGIVAQGLEEDMKYNYKVYEIGLDKQDEIVHPSTPGYANN